jgi:hypothetical protein
MAFAPLAQQALKHSPQQRSQLKLPELDWEHLVLAALNLLVTNKQLQLPTGQMRSCAEKCCRKVSKRVNEGKSCHL